MISEQRLLIFSHDSLTAAIVRFDKDKKSFLPDGGILDIEITGERDPAVRIRVQIPDRIFEKVIDLSAAQLAAIMIHYCIKQHIPIPKQAHKEIRHVGDEIALSITIETSARAPSTAVPVRATGDAMMSASA